MRPINAARAVRRVAFLIALPAGVIALACTDSPSSPGDRDEWADAASIGVTMQTEVVSLLGQPKDPFLSGRATTMVPVHKGFATSSSSALFNRSSGDRTIIRHFRRSGDTLTTVALRFEKGGEMPRFIYVFENGHIQGILSPKYRRVGGGYVRSGGRAVLFDKEGRLAVRTDTREAGTSAGRELTHPALGAGTRLMADVMSMFAPRPLFAEEAEGPCVMEWITYAAKSAALAGAIATFTTAASGCVTLVTCPALGPLGVAVAVATDAWASALDKLTTCIEKSKAPSVAVESSGGGGESMSYIEPERISSTTKTVEQFIDDSIDSGNYVCSNDGNVCTYYNE